MRHDRVVRTGRGLRLGSMTGAFLLAGPSGSCPRLFFVFPQVTVPPFACDPGASEPENPYLLKEAFTRDPWAGSYRAKVKSPSPKVPANLWLWSRTESHDFPLSFRSWGH